MAIREMNLTPLNSHDQRHVTAAEGYAELGMYRDADGELEEVTPEFRQDPAVLTVRVGIYLALEKWDLMETVAGRLASHDPENIHWTVMFAYAARRARSVEAAKLLLLEAVERASEAAILHYNLACYECQLGDLKVAKARLRHALKLDAKLRLSALDDEDLKLIWESFIG